MKKLDISEDNPLPAPTNTTSTNDKDLLIDNYLPNLSNYQKIKINEKQEKIFELSPNVNFTDQKNYYIFYNDNLKILIDLYKLELKKYLKKHDVVLYFKKDNLNNTLREIGFDPLPDKNTGPLKSLSKAIACNWYEDVIDHADLLAKNLSVLNSVISEFSDKITQEKMCSVTVSENLFEERIDVKKYFENSDKNNCLKFIKKIEDIKIQKLDDIEKLKLIEEMINELKKEINPKNSIDNLKDFCFVLNKISEYLSNFERSLQTKEFNLLKIMDLNRRKLDFSLLEFRFKFVENNSPILNIKINRYKILCDSKEMTSIYLEKGEVKNFIKNMKDELDKKAKNIASEYQFQDIELNDIIKVAKEINFNKYEDLINSYNKKINDYKNQYQSKRVEFYSSAAKDIINITFSDFTGMNLNLKGTNKKIPLNKIEKFLNSDKKLKEKEEKKEKKEEKEEKKKETKEEKKEETKEEKKDNTENGENIDKNKIKEDENDILNEKRKKNLNSIGIDTKKMSNEIIELITKSFQLYHDMKNINDNINECKTMRNLIKEKLNYNYDFFNILKLYCYLEKRLGQKDDYIGVILEEKNKDKTNELREYSAYNLTGI